MLWKLLIPHELMILALVIAILIVAKVVDSDISQIFVNGYDSLWQIALLMAVFAAIYPKFGYASRQAIVPGSDEETMPVLESVMESYGYKREERTDGVLAFRKAHIPDRVMRLWEDRITVTRFVSGYELEGANKDVVRIVNALRDRNS